MNNPHIFDILTQFQAGSLSLETAATALSKNAVHRLDHATVDTERKERTGQPETIFGEGKLAEQIVPIVQVLIDNHQAALVTRIDEQKGEALVRAFPAGEWNPIGRTFLLNPPETIRRGEIALVCAGTSDLYVAEECHATLRAMGHEPTRITDIGVAGLHRLLGRIDEIRQHKIIICIAGMEGALATVLAGLVSIPIIGVPTSIGYGCHMNGLTPLLGMLNSCAPGVVVCNIDNGYGAAIAALRFANLLPLNHTSGTTS
jgi:hypothetical protein